MPLKKSAFPGNRLVFPVFRLRIEEIKVRRAAGLEQVDDVLGLGREVRLGQERSVGRRGGKELLVEERAQGERAHADAALLEETTARRVERIHGERG